MRLTTRSIQTAEAIRDRVSFTTSGALRGEAIAPPGLHSWDSGYLSGADLDRFRDDKHLITYVVFSYRTPIAWYMGSMGEWHIVQQKFSPTTSRHQGNLYLCKPLRQAQRSAIGSTENQEG